MPKIELEDLLDGIGRKMRAKSILRRASGYSSYIERAGGTERFQAQVAHKQQSGGPHDTEPSTTVRPGILWIPTSEDNKLLGLAKEQARAATHEDAIPQAQVSRMKSTTLNLARSQAVTMKVLSDGLYDRLSWKEASVLAQLRTGMARVSGYLHRVNVAPPQTSKQYELQYVLQSQQVDSTSL
ncbi:hypothetical protein ABHI18_003631 [Aspergillus niger]